jgi:hypothetical protein
MIYSMTGFAVASAELDSGVDFQSAECGKYCARKLTRAI